MVGRQLYVFSSLPELVAKHLVSSEATIRCCSVGDEGASRLKGRIACVLTEGTV